MYPLIPTALMFGLPAMWVSIQTELVLMWFAGTHIMAILVVSGLTEAAFSSAAERHLCN
jgi:hypothetical protein